MIGQFFDFLVFVLYDLLQSIKEIKKLTNHLSFRSAKFGSHCVDNDTLTLKNILYMNALRSQFGATFPWYYSKVAFLDVPTELSANMCSFKYYINSMRMTNP